MGLWGYAAGMAYSFSIRSQVCICGDCRGAIHGARLFGGQGARPMCFSLVRKITDYTQPKYLNSISICDDVETRFIGPTFLKSVGSFEWNYHRIVCLRSHPICSWQKADVFLLVRFEGNA